MGERACRQCDECGSQFFVDSSQMLHLCPECAHHLYGYPPCDHVFSGPLCINYGWDGSRSEYLKKRLGE